MCAIAKLLNHEYNLFNVLYRMSIDQHIGIYMYNHWGACGTMVWTLINPSTPQWLFDELDWCLMHWMGEVVEEMIEVFNDRAIYYIICLMMSSNQIWKVVPSVS